MASPETGGTRTAIYLQDACYLHRYIRSSDLSTIVERPERLRAVKLGIAAAIARIEESTQSTPKPTATDSTAGDELAAALEKLNLLTDSKVDVVDIINSKASINLLDHEAVKFVHGDIGGDVYLEKLVALAKDSVNNISNGKSEIPSNLSQGDLYLCPESIDAIQGALGTVCEAVDRVMQSMNPTNAFVAIRPPGHHCGEDTPSGFCFVNNVAVAAAHSHLLHNVKKVVIFDIDLHHGNGTQSIVWQINEESYRKTLEDEAVNGTQDATNGLMVYYGSIHDILSYPCEDGKIELVQAASTSLHGPHGQHIENIHLEPYTSDEDFYNRLYPKYTKLLTKAEEFLQGTDPNDVLVFISCGFDACEHEYRYMSRHDRKVPTSFYHRFTRDARRFASQYAKGRLVSVLEGGYSDRALIGGAMAHVVGLVDCWKGDAQQTVDEEWWSVENLGMLDKLLKKRRTAKPSLTSPPPPWLERATTIYAGIETAKLTAATTSVKAPVAPSDRMLRERKPANGSASASVSRVTSPKASPSKPGRGRGKGTRPAAGAGASTAVAGTASIDGVLENMASMKLEGTRSTSTAAPPPPTVAKVVDVKQEEEGKVDVLVDVPSSVSAMPKKLPKVILRVKEQGQGERMDGEGGTT